ncbi:class I SAM-dependent methyltransferase [Candidatus Woesearchaeota archaeon]|nr:class I SAM-dependent methyltransferase [Candidatus Woesearchaeota archaeon]
MANKKKLEQLLKEMDAYGWDKVPDLYDLKEYYKMAPVFFTNCLEEMDMNPRGLLLDVCSGPLSLASVYKDTVAFDYPEETIKQLRKFGVKAVMGDIVKGLPFKNKSFDYVVSIGLPMRPYERQEVPQDSDFHKKYVPTKKKYGKKFVEQFVSELVRVAKKKVGIVSIPVVELLPKKHSKKIERIADHYVVYKVKGKVWKKYDFRNHSYKKNVAKFLEQISKDS